MTTILTKYIKRKLPAPIQSFFLLQRDNDFLAIEVKISRQINKGHLKGLRAIGELKGLKKKILVYPGERKMETEDKIEIWPFDFFHQVLEKGNLWD